MALQGIPALADATPKVELGGCAEEVVANHREADACRRQDDREKLVEIRDVIWQRHGGAQMCRVLRRWAERRCFGREGGLGELGPRGVETAVDAPEQSKVRGIQLATCSQNSAWRARRTCARWSRSVVSRSRSVSCAQAENRVPR